MSEYGELIGQDTLRIERLLPGPIERVWAYLTESEKRGKWFASGETGLRVGGKVQFHFLHASLTPHREPTPEQFKHLEKGVSFEGTVTKCEPPRLLAYEWGRPGSEVTFELTPQGDKVLLVITDRRDRSELASAGGGWGAHLGILEDVLAGEPPRPFWSNWLRFNAEYTRRLAE